MEIVALFYFEVQLHFGNIIWWWLFHSLDETFVEPFSPWVSLYISHFPFQLTVFRFHFSGFPFSFLILFLVWFFVLFLFFFYGPLSIYNLALTLRLVWVNQMVVVNSPPFCWSCESWPEIRCPLYGHHINPILFILIYPNTMHFVAHSFSTNRSTFPFYLNFSLISASTKYIYTYIYSIYITKKVEENKNKILLSWNVFLCWFAQHYWLFFFSWCVARGRKASRGRLIPEPKSQYEFMYTLREKRG